MGVWCKVCTSGGVLKEFYVSARTDPAIRSQRRTPQTRAPAYRSHLTRSRSRMSWDVAWTGRASQTFHRPAHPVCALSVTVLLSWLLFLCCTCVCPRQRAQSRYGSQLQRRTPPKPWRRPLMHVCSPVLCKSRISSHWFAPRPPHGWSQRLKICTDFRPARAAFSLANLNPIFCILPLGSAYRTWFGLKNLSKNSSCDWNAAVFPTL